MALVLFDQLPRHPLEPLGLARVQIRPAVSPLYALAIGFKIDVEGRTHPVHVPSDTSALQYFVPSGAQFSGAGVGLVYRLARGHALEHGNPSRGRKRCPVKSPLMRHPLPGIVRHVKEFHNVRPSHYGPAGHTASDHLGKTRQVRPQPVEHLGTARTEAKAGDHFVENQHHPALSGHRLQIAQKLWR